MLDNTNCGTSSCSLSFTADLCFPSAWQCCIHPWHCPVWSPLRRNFPPIIPLQSIHLSHFSNCRIQ
jgi:hypothetical protein